MAPIPYFGNDQSEKNVVVGETHCRDPADCPLYPLHTCFATVEGLVCKNAREYEGFEMSVNYVETFNYRPYIRHNDTGEPCHLIPRSSDLESYVDFRGPQAMTLDDLDMMGNCSRLSYCDKQTKTCQPKHGMGSTCKYNMECAVGLEYYPGYCDKNTSQCGMRQDIPSFYYGGTIRPFTMGKYWKEAVAAVVVTGTLALCFLVGRHQAGKLVSGVSCLIEKWQNRDPTQTNHSLSDEEIWHQQHCRRPWWSILPQRMTRFLQPRDDGTYVPLDTRPLDPPPYRGD
ncbi:uncharacterized protein BX664DRAFT_383632 [Halteromyces radiatus]|uniref:uncharacterized protein n=1 Tax=Halteromyces radiatus TaxID=101107 RepID=UPI00221FDDD4|nr:uncharacterized protein BX664DRAFT_383632 [Halteromyces radiatus]KAI8097327.1 hypothetical protein BX664DRAFT_383632 [Halteromyces radiatus]